MKQLKVMIFVAALVTGLFVNTRAQNSAPSNKAAAQNSSTNAQAESRKESSETAPPTVPTLEVTALIPVADTSPSVRKQLGEIKLRAKELIAAAPAGTRVGVVGINWEATKQIFTDTASAEKKIDSLTIGGKYSDLGRGNDAALSLIQEAGARRAAIVFLTDGKATVPTTFKNRETFIEMLRREYTPRPNIRVIVVIVKGNPLPPDANLPPNVTFVQAKDWTAAREVIAKELAPQIKTQLAPEDKTSQNSPSSNSAPDRNPVGSEEQSGLVGLFAAGVGLAVVAVIILPLYFWFVRRRPAADPTTEIEEPENVLRDEELKDAAMPSSPEMVLILQAEWREDEQSKDVRFENRRALVRADEWLTVGNSRFVAGFELPGLKQAQSLEIAFDGTQATVFRLRPAANESLEDVTLEGGENAPAKFSLRPNEKFRVGDYEIELMLADENVAGVIATAPRTISTMISASAETSRMPQLRGGRLRRSGG